MYSAQFAGSPADEARRLGNRWEDIADQQQDQQDLDVVAVALTSEVSVHRLPVDRDPAAGGARASHCRCFWVSPKFRC